MRIFSQFSLRLKVLLAIFISAVVLISATVFGIMQLRGLEVQVREVNIQYVPLLKSLSQLESHQFLLEKELDRALEQGLENPESVHVGMMRAKLEGLLRLFSSGMRKSSELDGRLRTLKESFDSFLVSTEKIFKSRLDSRYRANFSSSKSKFETELKEFIKYLDTEIRNKNLVVERSMTKSISLIVGLLAVFLLLAAAVVFWVDRQLEPLQRLTDIVRTISYRGLKKNDISLLAVIEDEGNELSIFSQEFRKMSESLLVRSEELSKERKSLEKAKNTLTAQNETLRRTKAKLVHQEKLGLIGKLSAQMAHEIRNPLNALSLHLESLEFEVLDPSKNFNESIECMKKEITRLSSVSSNYLNLARSPRTDFEVFDLNQLVSDVIDLYSPLLREKKIEVLSRLDRGVRIEGDRKNLSLVVGNLVKNAIDSLSSTSLIRNKRWILVSTKIRSDSGQIQLTVSDNGIGITGESQEAIFNPFYTTKASGTGLGLSHSKQIVDAHGGEIFHRARKGGATFIVNMPFRGDS